MMSKNPQILQQQASDPLKSCWVMANAGTGKTKVLIDRILRLLLTGVEPSEILCITFTNAAKNVITNRVVSELSNLANTSKNQLISKLKGLLNLPTIGDDLLVTARELCSKVLDSSSGLKIHTIHSFCANLITSTSSTHLNKNLDLLDNTNANNIYIKEQCLLEILNYISSNNHINYEVLLYHLSEYSIIKTIEEAYKNQNIFMHINKVYESTNTLKQAIYNFFEADISQKSHSYLYSQCQDSCFNLNGFNHLLEILKDNNISKHRTLNLQSIIDTWVTLSPTERCKINNSQLWHSLFFTSQNKPRKSILPQKILNLLPASLIDLCDEEANRLYKVDLNLRNLNNAELNFEFIKLGILSAQIYQKTKKKLGLMDYNDILTSALELLSSYDESFNSSRLKADSLQNIYQLSQKVSHILIDEAQDTGNLQWDILKRFISLIIESNLNNKSLFIVGDFKQSIYSFQGAVPQQLNETKDYLKELLSNNNMHLFELELNTSFRSAPSIIKAINALVNNLFKEDLLSSNKHQTLTHYSFDGLKYQQSLVEVWPLVISDPNSHQTHEYLMAMAVKNKIKELINNKLYTASDIMILFKKRPGNHVIDQLLKLLRSSNIEVSGLDRFKLNEHMAMMDIFALIKWLLQPLDDFNLALVLKSPFFDFDDYELLNLIKSTSENHCLFEKLRCSHESRHKKAYQYLIHAHNISKTNSLFELFIHIFYNEGTLSKFINHFGSEIHDLFSEFINYVLKFEKNNPIPTLDLFINLISNNSIDVVRNFDQSEDMVRFLTVHAAKGLEAKVVFLIDNLSIKEPSNLTLKANDQSDLLFLSTNNSLSGQAMDKLKKLYSDHISKENRRLLYVAVSRAKEQLYICGSSSKEQDINTNSHSLYCSFLNHINHSELTELHHDFFAKDKGFNKSSGWKVHT